MRLFRLLPVAILIVAVGCADLSEATIAGTQADRVPTEAAGATAIPAATMSHAAVSATSAPQPTGVPAAANTPTSIPTSAPSPVPSPTPSGIVQRVGRDCVLPVLQAHPVRIAPFDEGSGRAGDLQFLPGTQFNRIFMEYGFLIPANSTSSGQDKRNPQPTYLAPMGTQVLSPVDGVVDRISEIWSSPTLGDVSVMIRPDGLGDGCYVVVETEHVVNVTVAVGERVAAGQAIAEVGPLSSEGDAGLGLVELGVLTGAGNGRPLHVCPYEFFEPASQSEVELLVGLMSDWEAFADDDTLYDELAWVGGNPGCSSGDLTE